MANSAQKKPANRSSKLPVDSQTPSGSATLDLMRRHNLPLNRQTYLDLAYMGNPPEDLSAEEEMMLPEQFPQEVNREPLGRTRTSSRTTARVFCYPK